MGNKGSKSLLSRKKLKLNPEKTNSLRRKIKSKFDKKTTNYNAGEQRPSVPAVLKTKN